MMRVNDIAEQTVFRTIPTGHFVSVPATNEVQDPSAHDNFASTTHIRVTAYLQHCICNYTDKWG